jgi:hypothetical protein
VSNGDVSNIEDYYNKCIDQAETPVQRAHLREVCAFHVREAREFWEEWSRSHRERGLEALDEEEQAAEKAFQEIENELCTRQPRSIAGAVALLRYAHARNVRDEANPDDWDFSDVLIDRVASFLAASGDSPA